MPQCYGIVCLIASVRDWIVLSQQNMWPNILNFFCIMLHHVPCRKSQKSTLQKKESVKKRNMKCYFLFHFDLLWDVDNWEIWNSVHFLKRLTQLSLVSRECLLILYFMVILCHLNMSHWITPHTIQNYGHGI